MVTEKKLIVNDGKTVYEIEISEEERAAGIVFHEVHREDKYFDQIKVHFEEKEGVLQWTKLFYVDTRSGRIIGGIVPDRGR